MTQFLYALSNLSGPVPTKINLLTILDIPFPGSGQEVPNGTSTLAPSVTGSAPNTDDNIFFTMEYGFLPDTAQEPTIDEMIELICVTTVFISDTIQNYTGDGPVEVKAIYIDWSFNQELDLPLVLSFAANVTDGDGEVVDEDVVFDAMQLTVPQIINYIQNYIWMTDTDSVLYNVDSVNETVTGNVPIPVGRMETLDCLDTPWSSMMPPEDSLDEEKNAGWDNGPRWFEN